MKKRCPRSAVSGFTLIELLVVIGIIAILAAVTGGAAFKVIASAKRAKASNIMQSIQTATIAFNTDYGVYPSLTASPTTDSNFQTSNDWLQFDIAMEGNINPLTAAAQQGTITTNTRNIAYFQPSKSDLDTLGAIKNPFTTAAPYQYFYMVVDTDYSGIVGDSGNLIPPNFVNGTTTALGTAQKVPGGVAVWCNCDQPVTGTTNSKLWVHTY